MNTCEITILSTCFDFPPSSFCLLMAWFSWAKMGVPTMFLAFGSLRKNKKSQHMIYELIKGKETAYREATNLLTLTGLVLLACDFGNCFFEFNAEGFLIILAIFFAV